MAIIKADKETSMKMMEATREIEEAMKRMEMMEKENQDEEDTSQKK